jgi:hypothetical protein
VNLIVERARQLADDVARARSRRAFLSAVDHFERILAMAPDYPRGTLSEADGVAMAGLADAVVGRIEDRLDRGTDRAPVQRTLASAVYRIRADVEALYTFVRDRDGLPARNARGAARGLVLERVR